MLKTLRAFLGVLLVIPLAGAISLQLQGYPPAWPRFVFGAVISLGLVIWGSQENPE